MTARRPPPTSLVERRALLSAALLLPAVALAGAPAAPAVVEDPSRELLLRRQEAALLHRKVDLSGVRLLRAGQAINVQPPVAHLLIVHIWAVECPPCIDELPILRRITESLSRMPQVKIVLISETRELPTLNRFLTDKAGDIPRVEQYQSLDERLRASLQNNTQPTTLFLDPLSVVRQAFLGSLKHRRSEFVDAISRMVRSL
jgi:thiol-disulfide isomerase/thioredoxin